MLHNFPDVVVCEPVQICPVAVHQDTHWMGPFFHLFPEIMFSVFLFVWKVIMCRWFSWLFKTSPCWMGPFWIKFMTCYAHSWDFNINLSILHFKSVYRDMNFPSHNHLSMWPHDRTFFELWPSDNAFFLNLTARPPPGRRHIAGMWAGIWSPICVHVVPYTTPMGPYEAILGPQGPELGAIP